MRETHWPDVLADLTAKRDALDQVIETIRRTFLAGPTSNAEKPRKRTNERTNERTSKARATSDGASEPP